MYNWKRAPSELDFSNVGKLTLSTLTMHYFIRFQIFSVTHIDFTEQNIFSTPILMFCSRINTTRKFSHHHFCRRSNMLQFRWMFCCISFDQIHCESERVLVNVQILFQRFWSPKRTFANSKLNISNFHIQNDFQIAI